MKEKVKKRMATSLDMVDLDMAQEHNDTDQADDFQEGQLLCNDEFMEKGIATSTNPINMLDFNDDDEDDEDQIKNSEMKRGELNGLESPTKVRETDDNEANKDEDEE